MADKHADKPMIYGDARLATDDFARYDLEAIREVVRRLRPRPSSQPLGEHNSRHLPTILVPAETIPGIIHWPALDPEMDIHLGLFDHLVGAS